jgi:hypothetical protein
METCCLIAMYHHPIDNWNKVFEVHLLAELKEVFDRVIIVYENDFKDLLEYNNHIVSLCKSNDADLFITSFNEKTIFIETINEIKKNNKTLLFCPDNVNEPFFHKIVAKSYDLVWLCDNELLDSGIPVDLFTGFTSSNGTHIPSKKSLIATLRFTGIKKMINFIRYKEGRKILIARVITSFRRKSLDTSNPILRIYDSVDYDKLAEIIPSYRLVLTSTAARNT